LSVILAAEEFSVSVVRPNGKGRVDLTRRVSKRRLFLEQLEDRRLLTVSVAGLGAGSASTSITNDAVDFPTSLEAQAPTGSLIYDSTASGLVASADTIENLLVDLDDGQTVSIVVTTASSLQATITLQGPTGVPLAAAVASSAGETVRLNAIPIATPGSHSLVVRGVSGTTGSFTARLVLNAALELEGPGGSSNDTIAAAEDIDASWIALGAGAERGAVIGLADSSSSVVGPDEFGYEATAVPFEFDDIRPTGNPALTDTDDGTVQLSATDLPGFNFSFYRESCLRHSANSTWHR
jgi:hypothetical protein